MNFTPSKISSALVSDCGNYFIWEAVSKKVRGYFAEFREPHSNWVKLNSQPVNMERTKELCEIHLF